MTRDDTNKIPFADVTGIPERDLTITRDWAQKARDRLKEMGQRQDELADHIGCVQSNISQTLSLTDPQSSSRYAERISAALGIRLPPIARFQLLQEASESDDDLHKILDDAERRRRLRPT